MSRPTPANEGNEQRAGDNVASARLLAPTPGVDALVEVLVRVTRGLAAGRGADGVADGHALAKRLLFESLAGAVDADAFTWALTRTPVPGDPTSLPVVVVRMDGGFDDEQRTLLVQSQSAPNRRLIMGALFARVSRDGRADARRADLIDDAAWRGSDYHREVVVPLGLDEFAIVVRRLNDSDVSTLMVFRGAGRPGFGPDALALLGVAADRVGWLHDGGAAGGEGLAGTMLTLSPRERQIVRLLQLGDGRKQIATKLGLSQHTVSDYLKVIYRHFDVSSRGELQARFAQGYRPPETNSESNQAK